MGRPPDQLPKFIPEFVMNQLESEANLARLTNPTVRHLTVLLMETGLRGGDACGLAFNPIIEDSVGWPCLRFASIRLGGLDALGQAAAPTRLFPVMILHRSSYSRHQVSSRQDREP